MHIAAQAIHQSHFCRLQTIESNQRRKDIYQALTVNMTEIFGFFLRLIELHVGGFRNTTSVGNQQKAEAHSRVVQVALLTLTGFVEWVSIVHIMASEGRLLHILCVLLTDVSFQIPAAECLSQIVNRKGQIKDRKPLLLLFSENALEYIFRACGYNSAASAEQNYAFLKKFIQVIYDLTLSTGASFNKRFCTHTHTQILTGLGSQLTSLSNKEETIRPAQLTTYLETLFILTRHASLTLTHFSCLIWITLLRHDQISKEPTFLEYVPKLIEVIGPKVLKVPYPKSKTIDLANTTDAFTCIDYDSEEEYTQFFHKCRTSILEIFRHATLIAPLVTFGYCEQWLTVRLQKASNETNTR